MPDIHADILIDAPVDRVWSLAQDVERLPEFLPSVERVSVLSRDGGRTVSEWVGLIPEFRRTISWTEEDVWDAEARRCTFHSISGDWDRYDGVWSFSEEGGGARVSLDIQYEYNVPLIGPLIKKLLHKLVARSAEETLEGLRRMAEEAR